MLKKAVVIWQRGKRSTHNNINMCIIVLKMDATTADCNLLPLGYFGEMS